MATNKERIQTIYRLNDELKALLEVESDEYKKATENRKNKLIIERRGKEVEVTEGELWEEIRIVGLQAASSEMMKKMYPAVFEAAEKREQKNKELHDYVLVEFGFNFNQMTIADYLKLTEAMIDYKLGEKKDES